jgi:nucleoside-diphosphate-sugar epimerase
MCGMNSHAAGVSGRTIVVTGATGQIGRVVADALIAAGARVRAVSLDEGAFPGASRIVTGDVTDPDLLTDVLAGADAVVHLAALSHRDAGAPRDVYRTNVLSTFNVLSVAAEQDVRRVVLASSINVHGRIQNLTPNLLPPWWPLDADTPSDLGDWYSLSKKNGEDAAHAAWRAWGLEVVSLRFPFTRDAATLRAQAALLAEDPRPGMLEGWSYLELGDAARAVVAAIETPATGAHALFLAAPDTLVPYRTEDLLERYAPSVPRRRRFTGREVPIDLAPIRDLLGFRARFTLDLPTRELPDPPAAPTAPRAG